MALFQKDDDTICAWIREGVFPHAFKVKGGWYVPESDIKKMMQLNSDQSDQGKVKKSRAQSQAAGFVTGWK